jgi:N-methylhydantoinase A
LRPTIADANLVLGRLGGETRLGGSLTLDADAASRAIQEHVASPLGIDLVAAAAGILRVAHANIVRGVRVVSIERGHDPRLCTLVPFGGAGPMHGTPVARELRISRVAVPPAPGILSALGQLLSDLRHDLIETHIFPYSLDEQERAQPIVRRLMDQADGLLSSDQVPIDRRSIEVRAEARYVGQSYELPIVLDAGAWRRLPEDFHATHRNRFGHADPEAPIEIVGFGATAIGKVEAPHLPGLPRGGSAPPKEARIGSRRVFFEGREQGDVGGWTAAQVLARDKLLAGNEIVGPAVIEEVSATTVLYPGDQAKVHVSGVLLVECPL